jgi:capsular polysaccharide biosynthesis protein
VGPADDTADDAADDQAGADRAPSPVTVAPVAAGVVAGLVVAVLAMVLVLTRPAEYASSTTLLIDQPRALAASGSEGLVVKLSRLRVKYADIASADAIVNPVSKATGVKPGDVRRETVAFVPSQTLTVVVTARSGDAERAQRLSQEVADQLSAFTAAEQAGLDIPADQQVTLSVIDEAGRGGKVTPTGRRALSVAVVAFVLTAIAVAIGIPLLRDQRR